MWRLQSPVGLCIKQILVTMYSKVIFKGTEKSIALDIDETFEVSFTEEEVSKSCLEISPHLHIQFLEKQCLSLSGDVLTSYKFNDTDIISDWISETLHKLKIKGEYTQHDLIAIVCDEFPSWQNFDPANLLEHLKENFFEVFPNQTKKTHVKTNDHSEMLRLAEAGNKEAQFNVGLNYTKGEWVEKNDLKSLEWMKKSAEQNYPKANYVCGYEFYYGRFIEQDLHLAFAYFSTGAKLGDDWSQYYTGLMYLNGEGTIQDNAYAYAWFNIAYSNGIEEALSMRDQLKSVMSELEVQDAQKLTRNLIT